MSDIARVPAFALLGPGFLESDWTLVAPLEVARSKPSVVFVPYEGTSAAAMRCDGPLARGPLEIDVSPTALKPELDAGGHSQGVERIRQAIAAGDVYQVNLTLRAALPALPGEAIFAALCSRGVPPYAAWVRLPDGTEFVSASPELFFRLRGREITSQPMKGTAPVDGESALADSGKDAAELAMITDLVRNDLTPICEPRSVRVVTARRILRLPYAVQTVSDVSGTLLPETTLEEVIDALHPGGSVTGAPKHAARRMIAALETTPRGAYCGTLGLVTEDSATFSLLIRTAQRTPAGWTYGVGGGIVWDSDPVVELEEIHVKLGALR